ncbi:hemerythrin domain-containing protein [Telmatospirillum sp.]|uniref:bacteriohemerythrin n=1 Tax=Telmatospirillum sp. TaxID=2079197 RepID=UPI00283C3305|nr:hemerythrin domain-containing protein [Telmatospirillum sp.]MDR3440919.1 hemerythrin domain-containing protein [Telmatospirillum sp.]
MSKKGIPGSGNKVIDDGHRDLSQCVEEIAQLWRLGAETSILAERLQDLRARALKHFEEEIAALSGLSDSVLLAHTAQHEEVVRKIDAVLADFATGSGALRWFDMIDSIEHMLLHHEIEEDGGYFSLLGKQSVQAKEPLIGWTRDLSLGVDWIDQHHRALIDTINEIGMLPPHYDLADADALLERLRRIAWHHFHEEEAHLALGDPARARSHVAQHRQLSSELDRLIFDVRSRRVELSGATSEYLVRWLIDHIVNSDKRDFAGMTL